MIEFILSVLVFAIVLTVFLRKRNCRKNRYTTGGLVVSGNDDNDRIRLRSTPGTILVRRSDWERRKDKIMAMRGLRDDIRVVDDDVFDDSTPSELFKLIQQ